MLAIEVKEHSGRVIDHINDYDVIECDTCRYRHIFPIPSQEELKKIYEETYYNTEKPDYFKHYEEDNEWWRLSYNDRYEYFEQHLAKNRRRILDIGSGPGLFLLCGKERGWQTIGIEPSYHAVDYSRKLGLNIRHEFLTSKISDLELFDVINMSTVLEHLPNPLEILNIAYRLLRSGGLICVSVPNDYSPFQIALRNVSGYAPWWINSPHHINYFEPKSLTNLLERVGFNVAHTVTSFPIDLFLLMGDNYIKDPQLGRQCHAKRKQFELTLKKAGLNQLRLSLYEQFAQHNIGREIIIYGKRK